MGSFFDRHRVERALSSERAAFPGSERVSASALASLCCALALAAAAVWWVQPPPPRDGSDAGERFSVRRAMRDIEVLAASPRPLGSRAHEMTLHYLTGRLAELGLEVEVQNATVARRRRPGAFVAARVSNIIGRMPGRQGGRAVLLMAHYDSRPQTFGAADDAAGVAIILEVVRAIRAGPALDRDLLVLFTDGEEFDLSGARAFVDRHRRLAEVGVVLNVEARGNRGPSVMFETLPGNLGVMQVFSAAVPRPLANSLSYEVYRRMPNDSDLSAFRDAPVAGLNFAFIGNHPAYHTKLDSAANLDRRSLEHQGANLLALTRRLGVVPAVEADEQDAVYFSLPGWSLVLYSQQTAHTLAAVLVLLAAAALATSPPAFRAPAGLVRGGCLALGSTGGGVAIGALAWWTLARLGPTLLEAPHQRPYRTLWLGAALACLVIAWVAWLSRRLAGGGSFFEVSAGVLLLWTAAAVGTSWLLPGASFLFLWPALLGWIGWWIGGRRGGQGAGARTVTSLGALAAVILFAPLLVLFLQALTLSGAAVPAALLALLLTLLGAQLARVAAATRLVPSLVGLAAVIVLLALGLSSPSAERPGTNSLFYVASEEGEFWYSFDRRPDEWTRLQLGDNPERLVAPGELLMGSSPVLRASAPPLALATPRIESVATAAGTRRRVSINLASGNGGEILRLRASADGGLLGVSIGAKSFELEKETESVRLALTGPPDQEWLLTFEVGGNGALVLEVQEQIYGLADALELPPRPATRMPTSSWRTDSTFVGRRVRI